VFEQYTQYVVRDARGKWVRRARVIALVLCGVAVICELCCAFLVYDGKYEYGFWQLRYESEPGPWNGGHPLSRAVVAAKKAEMNRAFRQDIWDGTTGVLAAILVALLVAVGCTLFLVIERRRLPHFNELM